MSRLHYILYSPEEEYPFDLAEQAEQIARESGIHVLTDKDLSWVAVSSRKVVGAIFTSIVAGHFWWDTVVAPAWQRKGVGSHLIDLGLEEYRSLKADWPEIRIQLDVVNPVAQKILEARGLQVLERVAGDRVIMGLEGEEEDLEDEF